MDTKKWVKRGIEILLALTLPVAMTSVVAQGHEEVDLPSAEGQLSEYIAASAAADGYYPIYPGENLPAYPGDEKWNGHYVMPLYAGTAPLVYGSMKSLENANESSDSIEPAYLFPYEWITIFDLASNGTDIFAGLTRTNENGETENILARWNWSEWVRWASVSSSTTTISKINLVEVFGNDIYIGGVFDSVSGKQAKNIARWKDGVWENMGSGIYNSPSPDGMLLKAMSVAQNGNVYVGGTFNLAGTIVVKNVACWNGSQWQDMGGGVNGPVHAIEVVGNNVYVAGYFTQAGGKPIRNIGRWDGNDWYPVGSGPIGEGISALSVYENDLFAAVEQDGSGWKISRWNGKNWLDLGSEPADWAGTINDLQAASSGVYVTGHFFGFGDYTNINHVAYWDGLNWTTMGSGVDDLPKDILLYDDYVFVGGSFSFAGNNNSTGLASWHRKPELSSYMYWDNWLPRGKAAYLIGEYFSGLEPLKLYVNGVLLNDSLAANEDGKIYIHFKANLLAEPGQYIVELSGPSGTATWKFTLDPYEMEEQYPFDGYMIEMPASVPPLATTYIPSISK